MSDYPPKLLKLCEADFGSVLFLNDGRQVSVDVRPSRLNAALCEYGLPPLTESIAYGGLGVFVGYIQMAAAEWDRISDCLRSSSKAQAMFSQFPTLWASFYEPYSAIAVKVHRLYGGLSRSLYTSFPIDFRIDPNRPLPWYRALLSAKGGWLFNTWVHLKRGKVEIEAGQFAGHFVE
jgi:hypothetical protein